MRQSLRHQCSIDRSQIPRSHSFGAKTPGTNQKFIDIPSRDGKQIKSRIIFRTTLIRRKKYPMVIFVHGAGYLQNTINGGTTITVSSCSMSC
jgi:dipeptidyl aminopeptidase/acylaminoacyl peptidase